MCVVFKVRLISKFLHIFTLFLQIRSQCFVLVSNDEDDDDLESSFIDDSEEIAPNDGVHDFSKILDSDDQESPVGWFFKKMTINSNLQMHELKSFKSKQ